MLERYNSLTMRYPKLLNAQWLFPLLSWILCLCCSYSNKATPAAFNSPISPIVFYICIPIAFILWLIAGHGENRRHYSWFWLFSSIIPMLLCVIMLIPSVIQYRLDVASYQKTDSAVVLLFFSYWLVYLNLHNRLNIGLKNVFRISLMFFWGFFAISILHRCFHDSQDIRDTVNSFYDFLFPFGRSGIIQNNNWLTPGITFYLGCLVIMTWSKDSPCKKWNPFSAQDLRMTGSVVTYATVYFSALLYTYANGMKTTSFFLVLFLLSTDLYTVFLCNSQNIHGLVRKKLVIQLDPHAIEECLLSHRTFGIGGKEGITPVSDATEEVNNRLTPFAHALSSIASTMILSDLTSREKAYQMIALADTISLCLDNKEESMLIPYTLGFTFGFSCIPRGLKHKIEQIQDFYDEMLLLLHNHSNSPFYEMIRCGLFLGIIRLSPKDRNDTRTKVGRAMRALKIIGQEAGGTTGEFINWELKRIENGESGIRTDANKWNWIRIIEMEK